MPYETFHPLVFFWIAFYKNGECLPQFDLETGKENSFINDVKKDELDKFGLFPFNAAMVLKVNTTAGMIKARESDNLPYFIMKLEEDQRIIFFRRNFIHLFSYQHCDKCGFDWQYMLGHKEGEVDETGFTIYSNNIMQVVQGKERHFAQCPKCGVFNADMCPDCGFLINEMERKDTKEHYFLCPKCNKEHSRYIQTFEDTMRRLIYVLGYQKTVDGKNVKQVMFINEDGIITLKNEL